MISSISGFLSLNHLDMTSGANDVIVVRHSNGRLFSTPFNVRFGKVKVLRPSDKVVQVEVNGKPTSAVMKMGSDGEAFWLKPTPWSEYVSGRPESPIATATAYMNGGSSSHGNSGSRSPNRNVENLQPTEPVSESMNSPTIDAKTENSVAKEPLLEEDHEGHLKVNAVARQLGVDITEVQLAEETVVAAEMAMQRIAQMTIEYDDYIRETVLLEKDEGILSTDMEKLECRPGALENALLSVDDDTNAPPAILANTFGRSDRVYMETAGKDGDESGSVSVEIHSEKKEGGQETPTARAAKESENTDKEVLTTPKKRRAMGSQKSLAASDEGLDTLDDYLFEDPINPEEYGGEFGGYNTGGTPASVPVVQEAGSEFPNLPLKTSTPDEKQCGEPSLSREKLEEVVYFTRTLIPTEADLRKLNLVEGHNQVRYITHSSLRGEVAVDANVYLWDSTDRLVVSDVDGTITKSDLWGHLMPLIGRDWTHPGICSLYSKIDRNGYKFVYLTARSVSQVSMTRNFLWKIEQDGFRLPKGPVLTAPQRFFTALTQEVSKKSHVFKIACLKSVLDTFPAQSKPFYAGFGNRFNDVVSYTATQIPQHKIFIIDPNSVLHVYNVRQTYKNLAHLVDVTFPPIVKRIHHHHHHRHHTPRETSDNLQSPDAFADTEDGSENSTAAVVGTRRIGSPGPAFLDVSDLQLLCDDDGSHLTSSSPFGMRPLSEGNVGRGHATASTTPLENHADLNIDQEFHSFLYWRVQPADLVAEKKETKENENVSKEPKQHGNRKGSRWLTFSLGTSSNHNNSDGLEGKSEDELNTRHVVGTSESTGAQHSAPQTVAAAEDVVPKTGGTTQDSSRLPEGNSTQERSENDNV
ncbi:putative lipin [Trypanosoma cruzi]|uniref:Lipin, putative n=2 Tax=Trypanosoma cruzi TaxID=5693 RepID=Q4DLS4_TRYCC|nr:lipin, putative [Trypanosoma cruzi]EAN93473.1 lipin, putative [Trypanosoma cruzi]PWV08930.1 putative lipin [Trypanosoma cruzi]RNC60033.1 putative lipin [Trypanosoma cruzi]|eukprot:XP_815324.1 lipin [Trypanosoma cruzi strain CL Brener]